MSGIQPWSMPVKPGHWCIFASVGYPPDAVDDYLKMMGVPYKRLQGSWEGQPEDSWIVHLSDWERCAWLAEGENAILELGEAEPDASRPAFIVSLASMRRTRIGWLVWTGKEYATKQQAYTLDPSTDMYYTVEATKAEPYKPKQYRAMRLGKYYPEYKHAA